MLPIFRNRPFPIAEIARNTIFVINSHSINRRLLRRSATKNTQFSFAKSFFNEAAVTMETFKGVRDRFNGITVHSADESCNEMDFPGKLCDSLKIWKEESKKCIWFKVLVKDSAWIPYLAKEGFNFHHAREGYVTMFKWLPDIEHNLPPASHTNVGVGGLVLNGKNQILAVADNYIEYPHWKIPGGYAEPGEDIPDAAIREVKEETGVEAEFESLVAIRHAHNAMFGDSDLYVICLLKAVKEDIHICEREISKCEWMDVDEYLNHPHVHKLNRYIVSKALEYKSKGIKLAGNKQQVTFGQLTRDVTLYAIEDL